MKDKTTEIEVGNPALQSSHRRRMMVSFVVGLTIMFCLVMLMPQTAYAETGGFSLDIWDAINPLKGINEWVCKTLASFASWCFNGYFAIIGRITGNEYFTGSLSTLFNGQDTAWNIVKSVHQTAVIPVAESILALFMLVQLIKISQRIDATATLPAVKDIVFLAVVYVLLHWFIVNSLDLMTAIFDVFNTIAVNINGSANNDASALVGAVKIDDMDFSKAEIGGCIALVIMAALSFVIGLVAYVIALLMGMARAIQLYVMAAFSPIPISLLGFDETRQMGVSFLRNFAAVSLAGAIMLFLLAIYPAIVTATMTGGNGLSVPALITPFLGGVDAIADAATSLLAGLAATLLLALGLVKSGAWAKEILGA